MQSQIDFKLFPLACFIEINEKQKFYSFFLIAKEDSLAVFANAKIHAALNKPFRKVIFHNSFYQQSVNSAANRPNVCLHTLIPTV